LLIWRYLGLSAAAQYPIDRFTRVELGLYGYKVYETRWFDFFPYYYSDEYQKANYNFFYPDLALVFDNVQWGEIAPISGRRVRLEAYKTVFSDQDILSAMLDYRRYYKLSPRASLAGRLVAAGSFGPDPEYWTIGGGYTLRGYDYYEFTGSKLGFMNLEYRFPFIDRLKISFPLPIEIRNVRGALFADFGAVNKDSFQVYEPDGNWFRLKDVHMGLGGGIRFEFLYMIFKLDWARSHDFEHWTGPLKFYLSIGPEW
jgi:outer membrane protein assembly factor BamA